jgi:hypothetical protein
MALVPWLSLEELGTWQKSWVPGGGVRVAHVSQPTRGEHVRSMIQSHRRRRQGE